MKYAALILAALRRSYTRTALTVLSVTTAFLLFGLLDTVRVAFSSGGAVEGAQRLVVLSKLGITQLLPVSLEAEIARVPGVGKAASNIWFGGYYQDMRNFFPNFAIGDGYLDLFPEYIISAEERAAFAADRAGAMVGRALAEQFGWKLGDVIPMQATIFPNADGTNHWPLTLRAIFDQKNPDQPGTERVLYLHWDYFNESNAYVKNRIGSVNVWVDDPARASEVALAIDRLSENSDRETKTQTEQAFFQSFAKQFADVGLIVTSIMAAVFFTLMLLTGNTMTQAVRERIPELAVLKTLGFTHQAVLGLVLAEAVLLLALGGLVGMALANAIIPGLAMASGGALMVTRIPAQSWLLALGLMLGIGLIVGAPPAVRAMRLKIVDALAGR